MKSQVASAQKFGTGRPGFGRKEATLTLVAPVAVAWVVLYGASLISGAVASAAQQAAVVLAIVIALQLFIGNSGVLSFGHIAFVAVGAWVTGLATLDPKLKATLLPDLFPWLQDFAVSTPIALLLSVVISGVFAVLIGIPLMRLDGLQAGIATFAALIATNQVLTYWSSIGPRSGQSMVGVAQDLNLTWILVLVSLMILVSWLYQRTRTARLLRATREEPVAALASGIAITKHRLTAFGISGALCGLAGGMWAQTNGVVQASQLSMDLTFAVLAVLVLGGMLSIWGAVVGSLVYAAVSQVLLQFENGVAMFGYVVTLPNGLRTIILGAFLVAMLMFRPDGITRGREFTWPGLRGLRLSFTSKVNTKNDPL